MSDVEGTFTTDSFEPTEWKAPRAAGVEFGEASMSKTFSGDISGTSVTHFIGGMTPDQQAGAYVAMEWFEGTIAGRAGTCVLIHTQVMTDGRSAGQWLRVVPASGTGDLRDLSGSGGIAVDDDGTHRIWMDLDARE